MFIIVRVVKGEINRVFNVVCSLIIVSHSKWLNVPNTYIIFVKMPCRNYYHSLIGHGNIHRELFFYPCKTFILCFIFLPNKRLLLLLLLLSDNVSEYHAIMSP